MTLKYSIANNKTDFTLNIKIEDFILRHHQLFLYQLQKKNLNNGFLSMVSLNNLQNNNQGVMKFTKLNILFI